MTYVPRCAVCGQFTTHYMVRFMESSHPYSEDDARYCKAHTPS